MLTLDNSYRFHIRDTGSKHIMSTLELRTAFNRADEPASLARRYREERLAAIRNNDGAAPLNSGAKLVIHVFPLLGFDYTSRRNVIPGLPDPTVWNTSSERGVAGQFNTDGYICKQSKGNNKNSYDYMQLFRWGAVEIVRNFSCHDDCSNPGVLDVRIEKDLLEHSLFAIGLISTLDIEPPYVIMPTLMGVRGYRSAYDQWKECDPIDREDVEMPETLIYELRDRDTLDLALCDSLDVFWNALGYAKRMTPVQSRGLLPWRLCYPRNDA